MLLKYKKIYQTELENDLLCGSRYLVSVTASPNFVGSCSEIIVSFIPTGGTIEDEIIFSWTSINSGEVFNVNTCIDLSTLNYNCASRVNFVWDDGIDCCP